MPLTVALYAKALRYPRSGGTLWVYLNWALGFRDLGCHVLWVEGVYPTEDPDTVAEQIPVLRDRLARYGFEDNLVICSRTDEPLPRYPFQDWLTLDDLAGVDLLWNMGYGTASRLPRCARRSVFLDIDPALTQIWLSEGEIRIAPHDIYFTIGETVGRPGARFPDAGLKWVYTPPCVSLDAWSSEPQPATGAFTTVTNWKGGGWIKDGDELFPNSKRRGYLPYLDIPRRFQAPFEIALAYVDTDADDRNLLEGHGWKISDAWTTVATPWDYQGFIRNSLAEFSPAKPSCLRFQNAWISDRTICYLASSRPAIVQDTGPSGFLPEREGLLRFHDPTDALACVEDVAAHPDRHARSARALAEEYFDARKVVSRVLERAV